MHKLAFVIVGWNNEDLLVDCLKSIDTQTHKPIKVVYVDNASTDGSVRLLKKKFPDVEIIEESTNHGFAKANNHGIMRALEDPEVQYVALLNTDARVEPTWANKIVNFAAKKPRGAFFQGTTLDYYDPKIIDSTHIFVSRNGQGTQGNWRHYYSRDIGPKKVFGVNAAACVISRAFIEEQPFDDLFDESFFMYLEDVDVATRAVVMGWDSYLVPGARALHMGSATSGKNPGFSLYMTFRNNSGVLIKNLPTRTILKMLPKLIKGDIDTIKTLWRRDQKSAIKKVIKGRFVGMLRIALYLPKRRILKHYTDINSDYLWHLMNKGY